LQLGADGIELDVRLSSDGAAVVIHDRTLDRTTPLGGPVDARTVRELTAAGVPTLDDVLRQCSSTRVIVELKVNSVAMAHAAVAAVRGADARSRVCLGSFGRVAVRAVRALDPGIATSAARNEVRWALYRSWCRWPIAAAPYGGYQVPEIAGGTRVVSQRFVDDAHRAGLRVQVWTIDDEADARRLLDWGVDALITDRPDMMLRLVAARRLHTNDSNNSYPRSDHPQTGR